jgi:DHA1 family multidrug resistance protein-like MFS transporter
MLELFRDTTLGHFLRVLTRQKVLPYEEERDATLWKRYVDKEKSGNMARHGHVGPAEEMDEEKEEDDTDGISSDNTTSQPSDQRPGNATTHTGLPRTSSDTRVGSQDNQRQNANLEKGRDVTIVSWYSDNDPEVSLKLFRTGRS